MALLCRIECRGWDEDINFLFSFPCVVTLKPITFHWLMVFWQFPPLWWDSSPDKVQATYSPNTSLDLVSCLQNKKVKATKSCGHPQAYHLPLVGSFLVVFLHFDETCLIQFTATDSPHSSLGCISFFCFLYCGQVPPKIRFSKLYIVFTIGSFYYAQPFP